MESSENVYNDAKSDLEMIDSRTFPRNLTIISSCCALVILTRVVSCHPPTPPLHSGVSPHPNPLPQPDTLSSPMIAQGTELNENCTKGSLSQSRQCHFSNTFFSGLTVRFSENCVLAVYTDKNTMSPLTTMPHIRHMDQHVDNFSKF